MVDCKREDAMEGKSHGPGKGACVLMWGRGGAEVERKMGGGGGRWWGGERETHVHDPGGTRTCNLPISSTTPDGIAPLSHTIIIL